MDIPWQLPPSQQATRHASGISCPARVTFQRRGAMRCLFKGQVRSRAQILSDSMGVPTAMPAFRHFAPGYALKGLPIVRLAPNPPNH